jgi:hypothetical protein
VAVKGKRSTSASVDNKKTKKKAKPTAGENHRRVEAELVDDEPIEPIDAFIPNEGAWRIIPQRYFPLVGGGCGLREVRNLSRKLKKTSLSP